MSLFHNPRDVRMVTPKKRKKPLTEGEAPEMYSCELCSDEYDSETELHVHKKSKHRHEMNKMLLDEMVCKTCIKKQDSYEHLIKHIKTQHLLSSEDSNYVERDIYVCDICNLLYFNKQMLLIHMLHTHDRKNRKKTSAECPKCEKIVQIKNVWFHFERHLIQSVACCPICLKKCKNNKELNTHVRTHASYYHCDLCQYDASNKNYFATHMEAHTSRRIVDVQGNVLKQCFIPQINTRKSNFNAGLRGLRLYDLQICVLCRGITKDTDDGRIEHISQCHVKHQAEVKKKVHLCTCGLSFFNNVLLRHHIFKMKGDSDHQVCGTGNLPNPSIEVEIFVNNEVLPCTVADETTKVS